MFSFQKKVKDGCTISEWQCILFQLLGSRQGAYTFARRVFPVPGAPVKRIPCRRQIRSSYKYTDQGTYGIAIAL